MKKHFETKAIRTQMDRSAFAEHSSPLYLTSSFVFDDAEELRAAFADEIDRNIYSRFSNSNTQELVDKMCALEGAEDGVALRGDAVKSETYFKPNKGGHAYAKDLVVQINNLNQGQYLDEELLNSTPTDFCVGVAGYPEKHAEAPSLESDIKFLKEKIKAGSDYIITQMFFDNQKFFEFEKKCREAGIDVPIIPGLKPMATLKQLNLIPHRFHVDLPQELINEIQKASDNSAVSEIGIEWCIEQSKELKKHGVPFLHYYSMGKSKNVKKIAQALF